MRKFLAIVKREYVQRVRAKMFVLMTVLGPAMFVVVTIVPGLLLTKTGGDTRVAIVDQTPGALLYESIRDSLLKRDYQLEESGGAKIAKQFNTNTKERIESAGKTMGGSFSVERIHLNGRTIDDVRRDLNARIGKDQLDGYLVIPPDILTNGDSKPAYYGRNGGDVIGHGQIEDRLDRAVK